MSGLWAAGGRASWELCLPLRQDAQKAIHHGRHHRHPHRPVEPHRYTYAFAASLYTQCGTTQNGTSPPHWTVEELKEVYQGGNDNQPWRDMLLELSLHPDEEVHWPDRCAAINCTRQEAAGVLGAATCCTQGRVPFTKRKSSDDIWFKTSAELADMVEKVSAVTAAATS